MYAIYGNIYHQYTPNVSIYTIHGSYGLCHTMSVSRVEDDLLQRVDTVQTKLIRGPKSDRLEARWKSQHAMAKCS